MRSDPDGSGAIVTTEVKVTAGQIIAAAGTAPDELRSGDIRSGQRVSRRRRRAASGHPARCASATVRAVLLDCLNTPQFPTLALSWVLWLYVSAPNFHRGGVPGRGL